VLTYNPRYFLVCRQTITANAVELHEKVLIPEIKLCVEKSPFWSLMVDESIDSATQEQMVMYVRFVDVMKKCISSLGTD
jgi:hypothetical protein